MILLALRMISKLGIQPDLQHLRRHAKEICHGVRQLGQQPGIETSDRQQLQQLHRAWAVGLLQPYRFSLWCSVTRSMFRISAARVWFQPTVSRVIRMCAFSTSSRLLGAPFGTVVALNTKSVSR